MATSKRHILAESAFGQPSVEQNELTHPNLISRRRDSSVQIQELSTQNQEVEVSTVAQMEAGPLTNAEEIRRLEKELEAAGVMSEEEISKRGHTKIPASHQLSLAEFLQDQD